MFFRLIWRLTRHNFGLHYFWPLIIAFAIESFIASLQPDWHGLKNHWLSLSHLAGLISVYVTFIWVIAIYLKKASDVRSTRVQTLDDLLPRATRYFAIGTIPLKEWFDPESQVYLSTVVRYQHCHKSLKHERVLFFFSDYQLQALKASYLDEHPARCILAIHKRLDIKLAFLGPEQLLRIFSELTDDEKHLLGVTRRWLEWLLPSSWRQVKPFWRLRHRRQPKGLPFVTVETDQGKVFLRFVKGKTVLGIDEINKESGLAKACASLVSKIEATIYSDLTTRTLKNEFDFEKFMCP